MLIDAKQAGKSRRLAQMLVVLLVLSLLAALLPTAASGATLAAEEVKCSRHYGVNRNSTLKKIADAFGYTPAQIAEANEMKSPYTIYVGQSLCIPSKKVSDLKSVPSSNANAKAVYFVAGRQGDYILLHMYNYPKTTVLIKAADAAGGKFYKVSTITDASVFNGKSLRYKIPSDLLSANKLKICLKDRTTSHLQCVYQLYSGG
jgi:LysM repeat protein